MGWVLEAGAETSRKAKNIDRVLLMLTAQSGKASKSEEQ